MALRLFAGRVISGSISLPSPGFFSPFPHGTGCTIGDKSYLALPSGLGGFTRGSTCSVLLGYHLNSWEIYMYGAITLYGRTFQSCFINLHKISVSNPSNSTLRKALSLGGWWWPHYPNRQADWFRLFRVRSPLLAESLRFLFLRLLGCFGSPGYLHKTYVFS